MPPPAVSSRRLGSLFGFLAVTFVAAAIGSAATFRSVETWYPTLVKPTWTPPSVLFGPVWSVLFVSMAVAAWRIWRLQSGSAARATLWFYAGQLGLNALWSVLFFGLRRPDLALLDIAGLCIVLAILGVRFWPVDRIAALLWAPYVMWVSFAFALNAALWWLNR